MRTLTCPAQIRQTAAQSRPGACCWAVVQVANFCLGVLRCSRAVSAFRCSWTAPLLDTPGFSSGPHKRRHGSSPALFLFYLPKKPCHNKTQKSLSLTNLCRCRFYFHTHVCKTTHFQNAEYCRCPKTWTKSSCDRCSSRRAQLPISWSSEIGRRTPIAVSNRDV